jgi:hypothetical protein
LTRAETTISTLREQIASLRSAAAATTPKNNDINNNNNNINPSAFLGQLAAAAAVGPAVETGFAHPHAATNVLAETLNIVDIDFEFTPPQRQTQASKRIPGSEAAAVATKRIRSIPVLQHISQDEVDVIDKAAIDTSKLSDVGAAWETLDWAYGIFQKNKGSAQNPPLALQKVKFDHSKERPGQQETSPFEEWLVRVLLKLAPYYNSNGNDKNLWSCCIFKTATGRRDEAYRRLVTKFKK